MGSNEKKWICDYCTYENFPLSHKCTMCRCPQPIKDIFSLSPPASITPIIEAPKIESPPAIKKIHNANPDNDSNPKPNNLICNLNCSQSSQCIQCSTKREPSPTTDTTHLIEDVRKLNIRTSNPDLSSSNLIKNNSPLASSSNLTITDPNDGLRLCSSNETLNKKSELKWQCFICTYQNYPKSIKCSMCGTAKDENSIMSNEADYVGENDINLDDMISGASNFNIINNSSSCSSSMKQHSNTEISYTAKNNLKNLPNNYDIASNHLNLATINNNNNNNINNNNNHNNINNINNINNANIYQLSSNELDVHQERRVRQLKRQADWIWLNACVGVVENNFVPVEHYLARGGNVNRALTSNEALLLNRNSAYDAGHTLIHLAIRFHREDFLPRLLAQISATGPSGIKCVPSYVAPDLAADIRRHFGVILRIRKAPFNCHYVNEQATFCLPADIEELPCTVQEQLFDELLDRDAQKQLENPPPALNWSLEITSRLGSRLMVLWNRSAGDCLLDSAMQATWGVFDRDNMLRRAMADSLHQCGNMFYARWKEYEMIQAALLHFSLEEAQWDYDWAQLLSIASQPGASLEQLHIFVLAHIFRRPIIVYGVKYVKSFRGEDIGYARFEGVYLPLLWEQSFCIRSPIALGYTRGHFSALVPSEPYQRLDSAREEEEDVTFLPLMDCENKLIPIHFLKQSEMGHEETIMRQWLDVCVSEGGLLVAQQKLHKRPLLVAQMLEEWLNHYRRIALQITAPFSRRPQVIGYLSDGDTDEE